jgi:MOSC domain-containing protein YiiM
MGTIHSIHIAHQAKAPTQSITRVLAVPGVGLDGDRYALREGTFFKPEPDFELTLIELEALEALKRDYEIDVAPGEARRNLVTSGVALNHLVGREFEIGGVRVRGIRLCEPCTHLQALVGRPVIKGLRHRGGLRAQILSQGTISVNDEVNCLRAVNQGGF